MKTTLVKSVLLMVIFLLVAACSRISEEQYVKVMSDLGCQNLLEDQPKAQDVLKVHGVTNNDIQNFRKKSGYTVMMKVAGEIAVRVAQCHGIADPE